MPHGPQTARIVLTAEERETLGRWARRRSTAQALALRARIVLACADRPNVPHCVLAADFGVHRTTVGTWRTRFATRRLAGLRDDPHVGSPRRVSDADVERAIATTLEQTPPDGTHWSTRGLAQAVGLKCTTVAQIWRAFGLQPHRSETFKLSTDPLFVEKVRDIVGPYLAPPARAPIAKRAGGQSALDLGPISNRTPRSNTNTELLSSAMCLQSLESSDRRREKPWPLQ